MAYLAQICFAHAGCLLKMSYIKVMASFMYVYWKYAFLCAYPVKIGLVRAFSIEARASSAHILYVLRIQDVQASSSYTENEQGVGAG